MTLLGTRWPCVNTQGESLSARLYGEVLAVGGAEAWRERAWTVLGHSILLLGVW